MNLTAQMRYILEVQIKVQRKDVDYRPMDEELIIQMGKNEKFLQKMLADKDLFDDMHRNTVNMFATLAYFKLMLKKGINDPEATEEEKKSAAENLNAMEQSSQFLKEYATILL